MSTCLLQLQLQGITFLLSFPFAVEAYLVKWGILAVEVKADELDLIL